MSKMLDKLEGVICQKYDALVNGIDKQEHDTRLRQVLLLQRIVRAGLTLSGEICEFEEVTFLGHIINKLETKSYSEKVKVFLAYSSPRGKKELRQLMGVVDYLEKT